MAEAANYLENAIAQKLFAGVDFTISNYYGALATVPVGTALEDQNNNTLYSYEITSGTHPGYNGRFEITWNITDNVINNSNSKAWTVGVGGWSSVPSHVLVYNDPNTSNGDLLFYAPIPGLPGLIFEDDVITLRPNRLTIIID